MALGVRFVHYKLGELGLRLLRLLHTDFVLITIRCPRRIVMGPQASFPVEGFDDQAWKVRTALL